MNDRIRRFASSLEEAAAERRVPFAHGVGLFADSIPLVYDANYIRVDELTTADEHAAEADALMERCRHRRIATGDGGGALAHRLAELGWTESTHLVMTHVREPDRFADTSAVREVPIDALLEPHTSVTLAESYGTVELAEQLFEAKRRIAAAVPTRYFAISVENVVAAYCELRGDGTTSQIEDVNTLRAYRGRGLGRTIVQHALAEARAASGLVFVEALADDWPKDLYTKLGFDTVAERHLFLLPPQPTRGVD
jgi:GNAT superfamily N-acetyltransferase